jgi:ankyrin repeat protein
LDVDINNPWFESPVECLTKQRSMGHFYKSFAHILVPCNPGAEGQDQLDVNKDIRERLPKILANMPDRYSGELESVVQTLLGPPQLSAALCLLEVVVYLFSNHHLYAFFGPDPILQWIIDVVPFPNLSTMLRTRLPTLQAFQNALLLQGIQTGQTLFVKNLLELDTGLQDWLRFSSDPLKEAVRTGNLEMTKLILDICPESISSGPWILGLPIESGFSAQIARLFVRAGANIHRPVYISYKGMPSEGQSPLITALSRGDMDLARYLISVGADVNLGHERSDAEYPVVTPLRIAVATGRVDLVRLLLENHADVHAVCECGDYGYSVGHSDTPEPRTSFTATALQAAAFKGNIGIVASLLKAGSDINERAHGNDGQTALYAATNAGKVPVVELLVQSGAFIDAPGRNSTTFPQPALLIALERNDYILVELLLNLGANPNAPAFGYHGTTLLEAARNENKNERMVSLLLAKGAEDRIGFNDLARTRFMKLQLLQAIGRGDSERVHRLVDIGADIDMKPMFYSDLDQIGVFSWDQRTPMKQVTMLHLATNTKGVDSSLFIYLLKHAKSNDLDYNGCLQPILHQAVGHRRVNFVEALLDAGVHINAMSPFSQIRQCSYIQLVPTALHIASAQGEVDIVSLLLDRGANIDLRLPDADTPLQTSLNLELIGLKNLDVFELLLSRGADINAPPASPMGFTALQFAIRASRWSEFLPRIISLVQRLLGLGARVNDSPARHSGQTALQAASESGNLDLVLLLLDQDFEINAPAAKEYGGTALQYATMGGHIKIVQLLLKRGAEANAPGSKIGGRTALESAAAHGRLDVAQILINAGADHNFPMKKRYVSALQLARDYAQSGVVSLLQKYRDNAVDQWSKTRVQEAEPDESVQEDSDQNESDYEDDFENASGTDTDEMNDEN